MAVQKNRLEEEYLLKKLREIILREDREELMNLRHTLDDPQLLSEKVSPVIQEHLAVMKERFPVEYKNVIENMIQDKMRESQEELLNVLYPQLGKMIKKYITHQFQMLKESIDTQIKITISKMNIFARFKAKYFGSDQMAEEILAKIDQPVLEEIYLIQRESGLLLGHASLQSSINRDVVAGMLTAIKAFVEDAFQKENQDLEMIEYGTYKIFIQSFYSYYIAIAFSGSLSAVERDRLSDQMLDFAERELSIDLHEVTSDLTESLSSKLESHFLEALPMQKTDA